MKLKSLFVVAALALFANTTAVQATTFNYSLNGTFAEDNGGPSLVAYGGSLAPGGGYYFGVDQGLSLSGTGIYGNYSIDIRFYFDSVNASYNGFQKILDFDNRILDKGLYSYSGTNYPGPQLNLNGTAGALQCWACPSTLPGSGTLAGGQLAALRLTAVDGLASVYLNGQYQGYANGLNFSESILWFFMDDFATLATHPDTPEAGTGYIDSISVTVNQAPLPGALPLFATGLGALGLLGWRRKRKAATNSK